MVIIEKEFFRLLRLWASLRRKGRIPTVKSPTFVIMQMMRLAQGSPDAEEEATPSPRIANRASPRAPRNFEPMNRSPTTSMPPSRPPSSR